MFPQPYNMLVFTHLCVLTSFVLCKIYRLDELPKKYIYKLIYLRQITSKTTDLKHKLI